MNIFKKVCPSFPVVIIGVFFSVFLISCSSDDDDKQGYKHAHSQSTDMKKHPFEHEFALQCVEKELVNSVNKELDRERYAEPCMCIATYLLKDLTAVEADKFLHEKKHSQSLRIKYEAAAYHCLQKKQQPQSPQLFGKR